MDKSQMNEDTLCVVEWFETQAKGKWALGLCYDDYGDNVEFFAAAIENHIKTRQILVGDNPDFKQAGEYLFYNRPPSAK